MKHQTLLLFVSTLLLGCTAEVDDTVDDRYNVDIRWTSYGIPHVKADDWGSLGYGFAYATATDGICVFAREVVRANGTLSADFGESDENLASDTFYRAVITPERVMKNAAAMSKNMRDYGAGFVAGYNRFIDDHRQDRLADTRGVAYHQACVGADAGDGDAALAQGGKLATRGGNDTKTFGVCRLSPREADLRAEAFPHRGEGGYLAERGCSGVRGAAEKGDGDGDCERHAVVVHFPRVRRWIG